MKDMIDKKLKILLKIYLYVSKKDIQLKMKMVNKYKSDKLFRIILMKETHIKSK